MSDAELDRLLTSKYRSTPELRPAVLDQIADSMRGSLRAVRPLAPTWVLTAALIAMAAAVAIAGAALTGFLGIEALSGAARVSIFVTVGVITYVTARELVGQFIPGSRHFATVSQLMAGATAALLGVFALLFGDYRSEHFVSAGVACLSTGLLYAVPAALLGAWILRRGLAANVVSAGLALGIFAGMAGVTMLELHCTNFQAPHLLWHALVIPVSGGLGALVGKGLIAAGTRGRVR